MNVWLLWQRNLMMRQMSFPDRYDGSNLGRIDRAACKAFKAKMLLYAASPLFNCNPDYAAIVNPKVASNSFRKINRRKKRNGRLHVMLTKNSLMNTVTLSLYIRKTADGKIDFYESYRKVTSGVLYGIENKEQIFIRLADHDYRAYETTPYHHKGYDDNNGALRGGLGFGVPSGDGGLVLYERRSPDC